VAPEEAADKAEQQHAELIKARQTHNTNCNVKLHSIALGMGGSIEQKLESVLAELGVVRNRAKQTLQTLNTHAVDSLHAIWRTRQHALH
jgi:flagellar biosynthesis chaperone FliJ